MPEYCFKCAACGNTLTDLLSMSESNSHPRCGTCGASMDRDMAAENGATPVGTELSGTFWSESLAISPEQVAEHRQKFPDIQVDREGRVGFTSHKQREKYLEACGFVKKVAKLKR